MMLSNISSAALWTQPAAVGWWSMLALAAIGILASAVYLGLVLIAAGRYRRRGASERRRVLFVDRNALPPVSILKPVHGAEPRLAECLESFFKQDYPDFEIIIGARDAGNAALAIAEQVRKKYPQVRSRVVLSGPPTWPSAKIFSVDKMIGEAANQYLVISDSDALVDPDFLHDVIPPLLDSKVGLITCLYAGVSAGDPWSSLEALGMSVEMPSGVIVADMLEGMRFALGVAMATRRDALQAIGGIATTADYFSDDFVLGNEIWAKGYQVVLSHHPVRHVLLPRTFRQTWGHQVLWMKSTRFSRPKGHLGTGLTYAVPFGLLAWLAAWRLDMPWLGCGLFAVTLVNRVIQSIVVGWGVVGDKRALWLSWLYPVRDLLGFFVWIGSYTSRRFLWRGEPYYFGEGGKIFPLDRSANSVRS